MPWRAPLLSAGLPRLSVASPGAKAPRRNSLHSRWALPLSPTTIPVFMRAAEPTLQPPSAATDRARRVLAEVFGYDAFRGLQQAIVEHTIAGGDSLVLMPTGGGKSLCYQIPAM